MDGAQHLARTAAVSFGLIASGNHRRKTRNGSRAGPETKERITDMGEKYFCDGDCGREVNDRRSGAEIMFRPVGKDGESDWTRHRLCAECARKNVFLIDKNGRYVSASGFASDVLR